MSYQDVPSLFPVSDVSSTKNLASFNETLLTQAPVNLSVSQEFKDSLSNSDSSLSSSSGVSCKREVPYSDYIPFIEKTLQEAIELFKTKNHQYGEFSNPLKNFSLGARMHGASDSLPDLYEEAKSYQRKHLALIQGGDINSVKVDESLKDNIIYSAILLYMIHKHRSL